MSYIRTLDLSFLFSRPQESRNPFFRNAFRFSLWRMSTTANARGDSFPLFT